MFTCKRGPEKDGNTTPTDKKPLDERIDGQQILQAKNQYHV